MVAVPAWAKVVGVLVVLNELRGVAVAGAGLAEMSERDWKVSPLEFFGALALLVLPFVIERAWKWERRRRRIERRLRQVA